MIVGVFVAIIGLLIVFLAATRSRGWQSVGLVIVGMAYVFLGLFVLRDPPINWVVVAQFATIVSGVYVFGRALVWAISKTDIYQNLNKALLSVAEIKDSFVDFKEKWEKQHE